MLDRGPRIEGRHHIELQASPSWMINSGKSAQKPATALLKRSVSLCLKALHEPSKHTWRTVASAQNISNFIYGIITSGQGCKPTASKLLLGRLKHLCAPNHDTTEDTTSRTDPKPVPESWPEHIDEAIRQINDRILPALNATPRELLFGLPFRPDQTIPLFPLPTSPLDTHTNFTLAEVFRANAHLLSLEDAERRKTSFDTNSPIVKFHIGNLVQVYDC